MQSTILVIASYKLTSISNHGFLRRIPKKDSGVHDPFLRNWPLDSYGGFGPSSGGTPKCGADNYKTVRILTYPFPPVGLPPGVENLSTAPSDESWRLNKAAGLSQSALDLLLRDHKPDAIISDVQFWWTTKIANDLSIPRLTSHPIGIFPQVVMKNLFQIRRDIFSHKDEDPYQCYISVPDLPDPQISIPVSELPFFLRDESLLAGIGENIVFSTLNGSDTGHVVNTFSDLEFDYCEKYMKTIEPKIYLVGPLGINQYKDNSVNTKRGGEGSNDCLKWLDKPNQSVVFVCFGSWCHFSVEQLHELALGLEESGKNFLWIMRDGKESSESEEWTPEGWEERVKSRGLVIRGWAPQVAILRHVAVGAFLTHCGWNSILEAVSAGVPMLTWPLVFEQFINERFIVEVKGYGARVWEEGKRSTVEAEKGVVPTQVISQVVSRFMEPGGVGEMARAKLAEMVRMSNDATIEDGSSHKDLYRMINDLVKANKEN
ncbi:Glycosyltransferase [Rhynchospora pubera]|uniref:Glycosyltransferase n=1 Tax=Rhynchospora pubera TaxID=906938 RepID=A0AAV8H7I2_9POAL|nr:Glycosyltransferase [Rhynchospora pubera]